MGASQFFDYSVPEAMQTDNNVLTGITADTITLSAWINWSDLSGSLANVAFTYTGTSRIGIQVSSSGLLIGYTRGSGGIKTFGGSTLTKDTWYHACLVNRSNIDHELFLNGVSDSTSSVDYGTWASKPQAVRAGSRFDTVTDTWDGKLSNLSIYNRVLSSEEIKEIMYKPGTITTGLQCFFPLLEEASILSDYKDLSGNNIVFTSGTIPSASSDGPPVSFPTMI